MEGMGISALASTRNVGTAATSRSSHAFSNFDVLTNFEELTLQRSVMTPTSNSRN